MRSHEHPAPPPQSPSSSPRRAHGTARAPSGGPGPETTDFTRESLLRLLRTGSRTAPDLARELGVSGTAVRKHLDQLRLEELVEEVGVRRGRGRPAVLYGLSEEGQALFRWDRGEILETLLQAVHATVEERDVRRLLRDAGSRLARRMMAQEEAMSGEASRADPVERALHMLHRLGGRDTVRRTDGGMEILGFVCPLAEYVTPYPEMCHFVAAFTEEVLGRPVKPSCSRDGRAVGGRAGDAGDPGRGGDPGGTGGSRQPGEAGGGPESALCVLTAEGE